MEAIRKDLRERSPQKFDTPPAFLRDIPADQISQADAELWLAAEKARLDRCDADDRRFNARIDRRVERLVIGIIIGIVVYALWRVFVR